MTAGVVQAAVIHVPDPGSGILTIQDGIDIAVTGDEVVVAAGTHAGPINFNGKGITVRSESGPDVTIIEGSGLQNVVVFDSGEGADSVLRGFTVQGTTFTCGIFISGASPIIEENVIRDHQTLGDGAGIRATGSYALIRKNVIRDNRVSTLRSPANGAGLHVTGGAPEIVNNFILNNSVYAFATLPIANGGGLYQSGGTPRIVGNVFAGNRTTETSGGLQLGGAIYISGTADAVVANNTFYNNHSAESPYGTYGGGGLYISGSNSGMLVANNILQANGPYGVLCASTSVDVTFQTNSLFGNSSADYQDCPAGTGDLFVDPEMVDPSGGDYQLADTSLLVDQGTAPAGLPAEDIYGDPRIVDGDGNGSEEVDIGADELYTDPAWGPAPADAAVYGHSCGRVSRALNTLGLLVVPLAFGLLWGHRRMRKPDPEPRRRS